MDFINTTVATKGKTNHANPKQTKGKLNSTKSIQSVLFFMFVFGFIGTDACRSVSSFGKRQTMPLAWRCGILLFVLITGLSKHNYNLIRGGKPDHLLFFSFSYPVLCRLRDIFRPTKSMRSDCFGSKNWKPAWRKSNIICRYRHPNTSYTQYHRSNLMWTHNSHIRL